MNSDKYFFCSCCENLCNTQKYKIEKDETWICNDCLQRIGHSLTLFISNVNLQEIKDAIEQNDFFEISNAFETNDALFPFEYLEDDYVLHSNNASAKNKSLSFKVAGVTFKSGRKSRQVMLKNMYFRNTPPYDGPIEISFKRYDYEGQLAIGVYANSQQIGNVPTDLIEDFDSYWTSNYKASFDVYEGKKNVWGCEINVVFN